MVSFVITVPGVPVAKGRARSTADGHHYTPEKTRRWEADAKTLAKMQMGRNKPLAGPISVKVMAGLPVPKSWPEWKREAALQGRVVPTGKPDDDNLGKAAKDALNGVAWLDDAQIVFGSVWKFYAAQPGVKIEVEAVGGTPSSVTRRGDLVR